MDKMNRLSKDEYGCLLALVAKSRSEDIFTQVGACATDINGRVLGTGYNGLLPGAEIPDWMLLEENRDLKSDLFIHAESNLCSRLTRGDCHTLYLTMSPCIKCCQNIAALGFKRVVYLKEYDKCSKFKKFLDFHGISFYQLEEKNKNNIFEFLKLECV